MMYMYGAVLVLYLVAVINDSSSYSMNRKENILLEKSKCDDLQWTELEDGSWEVQNKNNSTSTTSLTVWWPSLGRCIDINTNVCDDLGFPALNDQFEGECNCKKGSVNIKEHCFEYHSKGPCKQRKILKYDDSTKQPICSPDLCATENINTTSLSQRKLYFEGTCYSYDLLIFDENKQIVGVKKAIEFPLGGFIVVPPSCSLSQDKYKCRVNLIMSTNKNKFDNIRLTLLDLD